MRKLLFTITIGLIMLLLSAGFAYVDAITNNDDPPVGTTKVTVIVGDITVTCGSNGSFTVERGKYTGEETFRVSRSAPFIATFKAEDGYLIDIVSCNVPGFIVDKGRVIVPAGSGNVSLEVSFKYVGEIKPEIISGSGDEYSGENDMTFVSNDYYDNFIRVLVRGRVLSSNQYTLSKGGPKGDKIVVTINTEYLKTLNPGEYSIEIVSVNGTATGAFTVLTPAEIKNTGTKTGDNVSMALWIILFTVAGIAIARIAPTRRYNKMG